MIRRLFILAAFLVFTSTDGLPSAAAHTADDNGLYFYRVYFTDKGNTGTGDYLPEQLLSPAAIARREKCGIPALTFSDLPVSKTYINAVAQGGLVFTCASKWMNTALFSSVSAIDAEALEALSFIEKVKLVKLPPEPVKNDVSKYGVTGPAKASDEYDPNVPLDGTPLHQSGFTGRNVIIAVLDAGFVNADVIESLEPLRQRNGILATYDFVNGDPYVYDYHNHGTSVLSILAGSLPGIISGTGTGADYLLLRTEDGASEFPVEEDYWAAAAEYADSAGADIISSSLGYYMFDDHAMDYSFSTMDGNTAFVTLAAGAAASKGILVVASAGNERNKEWLRILAPSDGDSVLCIGAVKQDLTISDFSSAGYSYDGRVKPDVVAPGVNLPIQYEPGTWRTGSGTSFSCPVISGLCASLMQAVPGATAAEVMTAMRESGDRYNNPDSLYGYGLPDFLSALKKLEDIRVFRPGVIMTAGPNPFNDEIKLWFRDTPGRMSVSVTDNSGRIILKRDFPAYAARSYTITGFGSTGQGIYYVKVSTGLGDKTFKMIRIRR
jgi:subtilisin family serine protease